MQQANRPLITPIYVKTSHDMAWPADRVFYLLAGDDLYLCRNHEHFRSSVPAPRWPTELVAHATSLWPDYPQIPRDEIERICGFFAHISETHGAEAIALLAWDNSAQAVRLIVPQQLATVHRDHCGNAHPIGVKYKRPHDLPSHLSVFGDIHSHCKLAAYASLVDVDDERGAGGLHIVVGRIHHEPPEFHVQAAVDGTRFRIEPKRVIAEYHGRRDDFPPAWVKKVEVTDDPANWKSDMP